MITDPDAVTVLCYGDSNTYGFPAEDVGLERWPVDVRWPGLLQRELGLGYAVIEEGLRGRTTNVDYADPSRAGCNGLTYLSPCVHSHDPVEVVIVMLGTNDVKVEFDRSPAEIALALNGYVDVIRASATRRDIRWPQVVLVSPVQIDDSRPEFLARRGASYDHGSVAKSQQLADHVRKVAQMRDVMFADATTVATVGADGVHLARDAHAALARSLAETVRTATASA